jgi:hypothetical protein
MAGLPWIKVAVELPDHPKLEQFEKAIRVEDGLGIIVRLWTYVARYYPDGMIPKAGALAVDRYAMRGTDVIYSDSDMFTAGGPAEPGECIEALHLAGWIDDAGDYWAVHDWDEFHEAHSKKAEQNRERQARFRQKHRLLPSRNASRNAPRNALAALPEGEGDGE